VLIDNVVFKQHWTVTARHVKKVSFNDLLVSDQAQVNPDSSHQPDTDR